MRQLRRIHLPPVFGLAIFLLLALASPGGAQITLYSQTLGCSTIPSHTSQDFETDFDSFDSVAADDFVVPDGQVWLIQEVVAHGSYAKDCGSPAAGPAAGASVSFYKDQGSLVPGVASWSYSAVPNSDADGVLAVPVGPLRLPAGHYWVSVQAQMACTTGGRWYWQSNSPGVGDRSAWTNPGMGFSPDCVDWCGNSTVGDTCFELQTLCGNSNVDPGEDCDDGNTSSGDGCSADCTAEPCSHDVCQMGAKLSPDCGGCTSAICKTDGYCCGVQWDAICAAEATSICGQVCLCGDGKVDDGEQCDDGNREGGDCCSRNCLWEADGSTCDDGNPCTVSDSCKSGTCTDVAPRDCSDSNPCTDDSCDESSGICLHGNNTLPCSDHLYCTVGDVCGDGVCNPGPPRDCADTNPCTVDSCEFVVVICTTVVGKDCENGQCVHAAGNPGTECRAAAGVCDVAETCDGISTDCPADSFQPSSTPCAGATQGAICDDDAKDHCAGTASNCVDTYQPDTVVCRAGSGDDCDPDERCSGSTSTCPADVIAGSATVCRAPAGSCDVAEKCTGTPGAKCPPNALQPSSVVCRASAGTCDAAETCTGSLPSCPPDAFQSSTATCRASGGVCDVAEKCTGSSASCPANAFQSSSHVCRALGDGGSDPACDVAEACTGTSAVCPANAFQTNDTACNDGNSSTALSACQKGQCVGLLAPGQPCSATSLQCGVPIDADACMQAAYAYCRKLPGVDAATCVSAPDETQPKPTCDDSPTTAQCAADAGGACSTNTDCDSGLCTGQTCTPITTNQVCTCGDANFDGKVKSTDALLALKKAVGQPVSCPLCACDVRDRAKREILSSDALAILKDAVGQEAGKLTCGACFHCFNGQLDVKIDVPETDVDCGGSAAVGGCEPCGAGKKCAANADCESESCSGAGTCNSLVGQVPDGGACTANADCTSDRCDEGGHCFSLYRLRATLAAGSPTVVVLNFKVDLDDALGFAADAACTNSRPAKFGGNPQLDTTKSPEVTASFFSPFAAIEAGEMLSCTGLRRIGPEAVLAPVVSDVVGKNINGAVVAGVVVTATLDVVP